MSSDRRKRLERALSKPKLNPAFVAMRVDEETFHVRAGPWTGPVLTIRETENEDALAELFELLDGTNPLEDVLAAFDPDDRDDVLGLLEHLAQKNVVYDGADHSGSRGWPQVVHSRKFSEENYRRLDDAEVLLVNAGEIGPQIVDDLSRSGVGSVRVLQPVERARADLSHLDDHENVTVLDADHADCADTDRADADPTDASLADAVREADHVAFAADGEYPRVAEELDRVAHETGTPWMLVQLRGFDGLVGPVFVPGETGCYHCLERRIASNLSHAEGYATYRNGFADVEQGSLASVGLPAYSRMLAGYAAVDLLNLLAYGQAYTVGQTITVNFLDLSVEVNDVLKLPRCRVCGKSAGEDDKRFVSVEDVAEAKRRNREQGDLDGKSQQGGPDGGR